MELKLRLSKTRGPENPELKSLVFFLKRVGKKSKARIWLEAARRLCTPARKRREVTLYRLNKLVSDGDVVVIPAKVVSSKGFAFKKKIAVGCFSISSGALKQLQAAGSNVLSLKQLAEKNPEGKKIKIIV